MMTVATISISSDGQCGPATSLRARAQDSGFNQTLADVINEPVPVSASKQVSAARKSTDAKNESESEPREESDDQTAEPVSRSSLTSIPVSAIQITPPLEQLAAADQSGGGPAPVECGAANLVTSMIEQKSEAAGNDIVLEDQSITPASLSLSDQAPIIPSVRELTVETPAGSNTRTDEIGIRLTDHLSAELGFPLDGLGPIKVEMEAITPSAESASQMLGNQTLAFTPSGLGQTSALIKQFLGDAADHLPASGKRLMEDLAKGVAGMQPEALATKPADEIILPPAQMLGAETGSLNQGESQSLQLGELWADLSRDRHDDQSSSGLSTPGSSPLNSTTATATDFAAHLGSSAEGVKGALPQIIERIQTMAQNGTHSLRLSLHPESLGQVELRLTLVGAHLRVQIDASSMHVREGLQQSAAALREVLAESGLEVQAISIGSLGVGSEAGANSAGGFASANQTLWDEVASRQAAQANERDWLRGEAPAAKSEPLPSRLARLLNLRI